MQKTKTMTRVLLVIAAAATCSGPSAVAQSNKPSDPPSHTTQIFLTNAQLDPNEGLQVIRAFVRTGTLNPNCLTTMGDTALWRLGQSCSVPHVSP